MSDHQCDIPNAISSVKSGFKYQKDHSRCHLRQGNWGITKESLT